MVATQTPPAFITANQQAAIIGLLGAAQQHAVAGLQAHLAREHVGDAVRLRVELRVGAAAFVGERITGRWPWPLLTILSSSSVAQFSSAG